MEVAEDIVGISAAFAVGIAAGAAAMGISGSVGGLPWLISGVAFTACSVLLFLAVSGRISSWPPLAALFVSAGIICYSSEWLGDSASSTGRDPLTAAAMGSAEKMKGVIDSIPYHSETTGPLVKALTTGDRSSLSKETVSAFRKSGASHILALSGLHLGIIYAMMIWATAFMGHTPTARKLRFGLIVSLSMFYAVATGSFPSIMRAALFITINETARLVGVRQKPLRTLCGALMIQLAISPELIRSVGFQLSYLAMTGIFVLYPRLKSFYPEGGKADPMRRIWEGASLSISCQVFTAPAAWIYFETFPKYFLLTNLIAMPLTSILMVVSVMTIGLSAIGVCPEFMVAVNDKAASALQWALAVISTM